MNPSHFRLASLGFAGAALGLASMPRAAAAEPWIVPGSAPYVLRDLLPYAKPICGTGGSRRTYSNTFPGVVAPFGMIQWSPDTGTGMHCGGYFYGDATIDGFSLDHVSGAGCRYGEDFSFMPLLGPVTSAPADPHTAFAAPFSHDHEVAAPGDYAVALDDGIKVELTATTRTAFGRFTYPDRGAMTMEINAASGISGVVRSSIHVDPARREVSGEVTGGRFCRAHAVTTIYFDAVFDRPFAGHGTWSGPTLTLGGADGGGTAAGAFLAFDPAAGRTLLVKAAVSYVSVANARANLEAENPPSEFAGADFDRMARRAGEAWNAWLNRIQVNGGSEADRETFYSMLYHALLGPSVCSDANGEYLGYDGRVHRAEGRLQYSYFSGWDIYRSECQLLAMIAPAQADAMAQSLLADYRQGGTFPRWAVPNGDSGVMMGDPSAPMIADFYAFGVRGFDARAALAGLVRAATDPSVRAPLTGTNERDALADYLKLGYVPEHQQGGYGNVSMTLEYDSADFALSQFAGALGDDGDAARLLRQAQNWRNLFNPETGYIQMRRRDGSWAPGFADNLQNYDDKNQAYVEGTGGQYTWMVPFNLKGLAMAMGGPAAAVRRLDAFFTKLNAGSRGPDSSMAWLGNEPCLETPWIYDFLGRPDRTAAVVRRALTELYSAAPGGYPGNDDLGEMSSWYIFGALGMYPELPGSDVLVLGSPLFPRAVLHLAGGDAVIDGRGAAPDAPYVQSLTVNGASWHRPWIRFSDISRGGVLAYDLGPTASRSWGRGAAPPPSYSGGLAPARP